MVELVPMHVLLELGRRTPSPTNKRKFEIIWKTLWRAEVIYADREEAIVDVQSAGRTQSFRLFDDDGEWCRWSYLPAHRTAKSATQVLGDIRVGFMYPPGHRDRVRIRPCDRTRVEKLLKTYKRLVIKKGTMVLP